MARHKKEDPWVLLKRAYLREEWLHIDTAPKDGTLVVLFGHGEVTCGTFDILCEKNFPGRGWNKADGRCINPTHWMALPEPPKETT